MPGLDSMEEQIRVFVTRQFPLAAKRQVRGDENWLENGLIDSLGILDLVHFLEANFSLQISDEELLPENFQSLDAVRSFVGRKIDVKP